MYDLVFSVFFFFCLPFLRSLQIEQFITIDSSSQSEYLAILRKHHDAVEIPKMEGKKENVFNKPEIIQRKLTEN